MPGVLRNLMRTHGQHWGVRARYAKEWRTRVAAYSKLFIGNGLGPPSDPKVVTFSGRVMTLFDTDGFEAAVKWARDGLVVGGILHDDSPRSGHTFVYAGQVIDRTNPGLIIEITRLA